MFKKIVIPGIGLLLISSTIISGCKLYRNSPYENESIVMDKKIEIIKEQQKKLSENMDGIKEIFRGIDSQLEFGKEPKEKEEDKRFYL